MPAEVSVRFSVQDAEAVRQALQKLGADGQAALDKLNNAGKTPNDGVKAMSAAIEQLRSSVLGLAYNVGPLGTVLLALGPAGLAVAGALGAVVSVIGSIKDGAAQFRQYARDVKDAGESTGLTTTQVQALSNLLAQHGVEADQASAGLQRFAAEQANAARGSGQLYTELRRINPAIAEAFAGARTPAQALDVLAKAISSVDDQTGILISRLAFGKGSGGFAAALQDLAGQGGLGAVADAAKKLGVVLDESIIKKQNDAAVAAEQKAKIVERNWGEAAANIMAAWKEFKKSLGFDDNWALNVSINVRTISEKVTGQTISSAAAGLAGAVVSALPGGSTVLSAAALAKYGYNRLFGSGAQPADGTFDDHFAHDRNATASAASGVGGDQGGSAAQDRLDQLNALTRANQLERERLGVLGDVASTQEKIRAKTAEVTQAQMAGANVTDAEARLVKQVYANQAEGADIATRASLGVASAEERRANFEERLNILIAEGKVREEDRGQALALYNKTLKETIENEQVRASALPGLQRMQLDSANLNKTLDEFGTSAATQVDNAFTSIVSGTQKASDGFKALEQAVISSLAHMVYQMTIGKLVAQSLTSVLGFLLPGGGGGGAVSIGGTSLGAGGIGHAAFGRVLDGGRFTAFAGGGIIDRPILFPMANGAGLAGEAGPEAIVPLRRGRDGKLGISGGGSSVVNNIVIENHGADVQQTDQRQNDSGGLDMRVVVNQAVKDEMSRGGYDSVLGARFGNKSGTVRR